MLNTVINLVKIKVLLPLFSLEMTSPSREFSVSLGDKKTFN